MKIKSILFFLLISISTFSQGKVTIPQAINIISKQSMLSQRMAKDKIYSDNTSIENEPKRELLSSVVQFENNLSTLKGMSLSKKIENQITHIELLWIGYKQIILDEEGDDDAATNIMSFNKVVLDVCQSVFKELLSIAKSNNSYPYNTEQADFSDAYIAANELKHTAQRLGLHYTSYFYKVSKYNNDDFEKIISDLEDQVDKISIVQNLNSEYIENTELIITEWKHMKSFLVDVRAKKFISIHTSPKPELIYDSSNKLLKISDRLGRTYKAVNEINN